MAINGSFGRFGVILAPLFSVNGVKMTPKCRSIFSRMFIVNCISKFNLLPAVHVHCKPPQKNTDRSGALGKTGACNVCQCTCTVPRPLISLFPFCFCMHCTCTCRKWNVGKNSKQHSRKIPAFLRPY